MENIKTSGRGRIKSVLMKPAYMWAIKHRGSDHKTANDYFRTKQEAEKDFATIPQGINRWDSKKFCRGTCDVGCRDEYEIVRVVIRETKTK